MGFYDELACYKNNYAAIDEEGKSITYGELNEIANDISKVTLSRELVFEFCENAIGSLTGYVSFLKNGVVPLLLDSNIEKELREKLFSIYAPKYIFFPKRMKEEFQDITILYEKYEYILALNKNSMKHYLNDKLGLLLTTSGSTGSPKLVRQSYGNINANAESIARYLELSEEERPITTLPMNYTYGLSIINSHLKVGATILLTKRSILEKEFWKMFREQKATSFGGVPYTYEMLKKLKFFNMELSSLKTMTQAGGKLSPKLHIEFAQYAKEKNKKFVVMYGQTEATARMAYLPYNKAIEKYGSMGIAIPGGRLELIDINGKEIDMPNVIGELVYYGENVTLGYAETKEDLLLDDERHGRLETGDMAKRDDEGYYYIVGRKKRFLKIWGNRVNLDEIEQMLKEKFSDYACACTGVDDKMYIFLTTTDGDVLHAVNQFLAMKTGLNASAFHVRSIDDIPKNEAGKVLYKRLEELYD